MTNSDVGIYSAAGKLVLFLLVFDRVFAALLLPAASRFQAVIPEKLPAMLNSAAKFIVITALPISIGGTLLSKQIIMGVFGVQFGGAAAVFQILVWYFFFTMLHTVFTSGLLAINKEKSYSGIMVVSVLLYCTLAATLTLIMGYCGTAIAVVLAEAITLMLMWYQFHKYVKVFLQKHFLRVLPAAAIMGSVLYLLPSFHLLLTILIGALIYLSVLLVTRTMTISDVLELRERM
jgi:O-antigen/teichoic acid export membrane protein